MARPRGSRGVRRQSGAVGDPHPARLGHLPARPGPGRVLPPRGPMTTPRPRGPARARRRRGRTRRGAVAGRVPLQRTDPLRAAQYTAAQSHGEAGRGPDRSRPDRPRTQLVLRGVAGDLALAPDRLLGLRAAPLDLCEFRCA